MEHFQVAWVKHRQWTPLGIHQPVSIQRAYGFQPFPCSLVADMQVYKLPGLCCIHRSRHPRLPATVASLNDFSRPAVSILDGDCLPNSSDPMVSLCHHFFKILFWKGLIFIQQPAAGSLTPYGTQPFHLPHLMSTIIFISATVYLKFLQLVMSVRLWHDDIVTVCDVIVFIVQTGAHSNEHPPTVHWARL